MEWLEKLGNGAVIDFSHVAIAGCITGADRPVITVSLNRQSEIAAERFAYPQNSNAAKQWQNLPRR